MQVTAYKTHKIKIEDDLFGVLDMYLPKLQEKSIVVITSKIVSICYGDVIKREQIQKQELMQQEADWYLHPKYKTPYGFHHTIKNGILISAAGIDESNGNGYYILWPKHLPERTNRIWKHLRKKHSVTELGIIIVDSRSSISRLGTIGIGLIWCGFVPLHDYKGEKDIFGKPFLFERASILDGVATAASTVMGEGDEQTPLAVVSQIPFVKFQDRAPSKEEIAEMIVQRKDDVYAPLLTAVEWEKGRGNF